MAYSNLAQLRMLDDDTAGAVLWGDRALALARRIGDRDVEMHALNNVGSARALADDTGEATEELARSLSLALAADAHEHAARAYTNLSSVAVHSRRFAEAEQRLSAGLAYCRDRDLDSWTLYMEGQQAKLHAELGRYDAAERQAQDVLRHPRLSPISRIVASVVAAQVALRRGEDASELLTTAMEYAERTGEAQRLGPVSVARAELAWVTGQQDEIARAIEPAWNVAQEHPQPWEMGELCWWLHVAGVPRAAPIDVAAPFALMLRGERSEAARAWEAIGCPLWVALSLASAPDLDEARRAVDILDDLGATATRAAVLRDRHAAGLAVPRGPRKASRGNPSLLTDRELEVLGLLVDGLTNAQIADRLFLSRKTVGHHVSAVLAKLGEPTRARAAAAAVQRGIVTPK
jgi:DNA-binding CsgD family transcriptional regulator/tetratricopeptide (TPR) repeat protein